MKVLKQVHIERILIAIGITFLLADTFPHPALPPGLIETTISSLHQPAPQAPEMVVKAQ